MCDWSPLSPAGDDGGRGWLVDCVECVSELRQEMEPIKSTLMGVQAWLIDWSANFIKPSPLMRTLRSCNRNNKYVFVYMLCVCVCLHFSCSILFISNTIIEELVVYLQLPSIRQYIRKQKQSLHWVTPNTMKYMSVYCMLVLCVCTQAYVYMLLCACIVRTLHVYARLYGYKTASSAVI